MLFKVISFPLFEALLKAPIFFVNDDKRWMMTREPAHGGCGTWRLSQVVSGHRFSGRILPFCVVSRATSYRDRCTLYTHESKFLGGMM